MARLSLVFALLIFLFACAGVQYTDTVNPTLLKSVNTEIGARVLAKAEEWRNSGVIVEKGEKFLIKANGRWRAAPTCNWTGPDGTGAYTVLCLDLGWEPIPTYSVSTLIAKIGERGLPFVVGNELALIAPESGVLYFRINDYPGWCGDNEGYVDVKVTLADESPGVTAATQIPESAPAPGRKRPSASESPIGSYPQEATPSAPVPPPAPAVVSPPPEEVSTICAPGGGMQRRVALVIGNSNYRTNRLLNPVNDATDMAMALRRLGFEVDLLTDADQKKIDEAIRRFGDKLGAGGERRIRRGDEPSKEERDVVALFFFAGHGVQVGGENYFIPIGADIEREEQVKYAAVPAGLVLDTMANAGSKVNIVLIDACRDNPFSRGWRSSESGLAAMQAARGMLIGYSTAPGHTASDGQGRNSPYTKNLLKYMLTPGVPLETVFKKVRADVDSETNGKQTPWESISIIGDFFFKQ